VAGSLRRAVRPGGRVYLTVEEPNRADLERAQADATAAGLPVVPGEMTAEGAGYHYYPPREQVGGWLEEAGLAVVAEDVSDEGDGYGYLHLLTRPA
jgi:hypothetical protein